MHCRHACGSQPFFFALAVVACVIATAPLAASPQSAKDCAAAKEQFVYVGTYTNDTKSEGIYIFRFNLETGVVTPGGVASGVRNPSFLAIHPTGRFAYSVNEVADSEGKRTGAVTAFAIDPATGMLTRLNHQASEGAGPCHIVVDRSGKCVLVANYGGGSVAALPIDDHGHVQKATTAIQHSGSSVNPRRQEAPHAHSINVDLENRFVVAADLGLDKLLVYRLNAEHGKLEANTPPHTAVAPGSGPRHFAFHPSGKFAYVINELLSTVTAFAYDSQHGTLSELHTVSSLPDGLVANNSTAEVQVHPSGKFVYGSNRGHDSIAVFTVDAETGRLAPAGHQPTGGRTPRNFGIDPTGTYLFAANQASDTIVVFRIDAKTGALQPTGSSIAVPSPVCVKFLPIP